MSPGAYGKPKESLRKALEPKETDHCDHRHGTELIMTHTSRNMIRLSKGTASGPTAHTHRYHGNGALWETFGEWIVILVHSAVSVSHPIRFTAPLSGRTMQMKSYCMWPHKYGIGPKA